MSKYYTGVGSRDVPEEIYGMIVQIGLKLASQGYRLRSGGALGCDSAFQEGCFTSLNNNKLMDIYIAWNNFNGLEDNGTTVRIPKKDIYWRKAETLAANIHPNWDACSKFAKALHTRNIYQVLGDDINTPSKFLICYAPSYGDSVKGGTRTAWELAKMYGIPSFNLYDRSTRERLERWLNQ